MNVTQTRPGPALRMQVDRAGAGRPLALIGGGLTGSASWQPHAERLAAGRDVARLQLLAVQFGLEDRPLPDDYSVATESAALAAALDGLGWTGPVDLVAWSYGALVTLDFALDHPQRVRSLTLIEPPALWLLPDRGRAFPDARALDQVTAAVGDDVDLDTLERFLRTVALVPPGAEPGSLPQWESWARHRRSLRAGDAPSRHTDDVARLRDFAPPVLLVTGTGTSPFLRAAHDALAAALPDARTLELPGGHAPQLATMDEFLAALEAFHAEAGRGGGGEMHTVTSRDGTPIAWWQSGSGPPLLLVHGATADHTTTWRFVLGDLQRHFTVLAMDRRGRGGSGDAPRYHLQREAEDVAAIVDAVGEPVSVLGHSHGALVALEAALLTPRIRRLVLYEGVPLRGSDLFDQASIDRLEDLLDAGDREGMLMSLFRDIVGLPDNELDVLRAGRDAWDARLRNAATLPRELAANRAYVFRPERLRDMAARTILLVGENSPAHEHGCAREIAEALPDARVVILPGQQHAAMYMDPALFVDQVVRLLDPEG